MDRFATGYEPARTAAPTHRTARRGRIMLALALACALALGTVGPLYAAPPPPRGPGPNPSDWAMYLHDPQHTNVNNEGILSGQNVGNLRVAWSALTGGPIAASPTIAGGVVYVGSWDGYEYAIDAQTGAVKWKTFLGTTSAPACWPPVIGVTSAATVVGGVVYVGGGDANWDALDANTGSILWQVYTGDNSATGGHYNWSSPLIYNGYAFIGIASNCDIPLVQGQLLQVSLTTHQVVNTFNFVPSGEVGGGVWTTPAVDPATNTVFVTTGTLSISSQRYSEAIVALDATTLALKSVWQLPRSEAGSDSDWGTSPTLITDASGRALVVAANKNGIVYAWDRNNLAAGPLWRRWIAISGECPQCGSGTISSGAFANGVLYYAGGLTEINGAGYAGAVRAIDPATGNVLWEHGTSQPVIAAIAYDDGLVIDAQGSVIEALDAATGHSLFTYQTGGPIYSAPSIYHGTIYAGSTDNRLYALRLPGGPQSPLADPNCPSGLSCQDIGAPARGTEQVANGVWQVSAAGAGLQGTSDQLRFLWRAAPGDLQVTARLVAQGAPTPPGAAPPQLGLLVRQNASSDAPFYAVVESSGALVVLARSAFGGPVAQVARLKAPAPPFFLMLQRHGDVFTAAVSADGSTYTLIPGAQRVVVLPYQLLAGLAADSGSAAATSAATFDSVTIGAPTLTPAPPASATPCPAGWSCQDVGDPAPVGDQTLASGAWTLSGVGGNIGGGTDAVHYVWQTLPGDGTFTAEMTAQGATASAMAGLMFRQSLAAGSPYFGIFVSRGKGVTVSWRTVSNINDGGSATLAGAAPLWLQVQRYTDPTSGTVYFVAYTSSDGATWNPVPGATATVALSGPLLVGLAATAGNSATPVAASFGGVALSTTSPRPNTLCADGWTCQDIGTATPPGTQIITGGTWQVRAGGYDIWNLYDDFRFTSQPLASGGNGTISARVVAENGGAWQKSGVMLRASSDPSAMYYAVFATPSNGIVVQYRAATDGPTSQLEIPGTAPAYLQVARYIDTSRSPAVAYFTAYTSPDSATWTEIPGSTVALDMGGALLAGLAADAFANGYATTTFDSVALATTAPAPRTICPPGWDCADIGGATPAGSQQMANGTWTVAGGGGDIWSTSDAFRYLWQTLPGDGSVSAQLTAQTATDPWAKAGVMLRESSDAGSPYYGVFMTPSNGIAVQYRLTPGGITSQVVSPGAEPAYLLVERYTDPSTSPATVYLTAFTSTDGAIWTAIPKSTIALSVLTLNLTGPLLAGLAVTSHTTGALSSVAFSGVTIGGGAPPSPDLCPTGWSCGDIGNPSVTGQQALASGTWTVSGSGGDIWGSADAFRYVWQTLPGDGSVGAEITAQTATDPWTKTGVMLRASTDPGAPYYALLMTPSNGIAVQYRATAGGTSSQVVVAGAEPAYLLVARSGTTFTAYTSPDGVTWTAIAGSSVSLPGLSGPLLAGLAVTAHAWGVLSTATFTSVSVGALVPTAPPLARVQPLPAAAVTAIPTPQPEPTPAALPSGTPLARP
jgi:outer membrane protein assembly factor BamB